MRPNAEVEFRHKKTGCGTRLLLNIPPLTIETLKDVLSLPGLDIEVTAVAWPYSTLKRKT